MRMNIACPLMLLSTFVALSSPALSSAASSENIRFAANGCPAINFRGQHFIDLVEGKSVLPKDGKNDWIFTFIEIPDFEKRTYGTLQNYLRQESERLSVGQVSSSSIDSHNMGAGCSYTIYMTDVHDVGGFHRIGAFKLFNRAEKGHVVRR